MYNLIIGIDPGVSGGIAVIVNNKVAIMKMPKREVTVNGKKRNETNVGILIEMLSIYTKGHNAIVFIEKVSMRPSDNKGKQFQIVKMLANYEALKTIINILGVPMIQVMPRVWQKYLNLVKAKEESKDRKKRYKRFASDITGMKTALWNSDAICIAEFGRRKVKLEPDWILEKI